MTEQATTETTEAPVAGTETAPVETSSPEVKEAEVSAKEIMEFDPFGPAKSQATEGAPTPDDKGKGKVGEEPKVETKPEAPKPAETPVQPGTQPAQPNEVAELKAQIAALNRVIQESRPPAPAGDKKDVPDKPFYDLSIPPPVMAALRSEDDNEFGLAMTAVINGIANKVRNDLLDHVSKEVMPSVSKTVEATLSRREETNRVRQEFYGKYPHLNNPTLHTVVQNAAVQVATQWAALGRQVQWGPEFADAVAGLIHQAFPQVVPQTQQPQLPLKPKQFAANPGARMPAPAASEFADVL